MDTLLLIITYAYLTFTTFGAGLTSAGGLLIAIAGVVLVGEYISLKKTGYWISDHIKAKENKSKQIMALVLFFGALVLHFLVK
jgi:hypothetical protein